MEHLSTREQARLNRIRSLPMLLGSGLAFALLVVYSGFGVLAMLALVLFCMTAWYMLTAEKKLEEDATYARAQAADETRLDGPGAVSFATAFGAMYLDEEAEAWVAYPKPQGPPEVRIPAEWDRTDSILPPRQALLAAVSHLHEQIDAFEAAALESARLEGRMRPELRRFEPEIAELRVACISFLDIDAPTNCVVQFLITPSGHHWFCRYSDGKAVEGSLGFDT